MKKRPIQPILKRRFRRLEKDEAKTRKALLSLYKAHAVDIASFVHAAYLTARDGDRLRHANLMKRIDSNEATKLRRDGAKQGVVLKFDALNKMEGIEAGLLIAEYAIAEEEQRLLTAHLKQNIEDTWEEVEEYLEYYYATMTAAALAVLLSDERYPIAKTLRGNHKHLAEMTARRIEQNIVRGMNESDAVKDVVDYVTRRERSNSDSVLYYEGTRTTNETVRAVVDDIADYFYTVCVNDNKTCKQCKEIEAEQAYFPVPLTDYEAGITAPPFHPYCRCGIEVIYHDAD